MRHLYQKTLFLLGAIFSFSSHGSALSFSEDILQKTTEDVAGAGANLDVLSTSLSKALTYFVGVFRNFLDTFFAKEPSAYLGNNGNQLVVKLVLIVGISVLSLFLFRRFIQRVWLVSPSPKKSPFGRGDRIFFYILPWVGFVLMGMLFTRFFQLPFLLETSVNCILFIVASSFPIRQISLFTYKLQSNLFDPDYGKKLRKVAPPFVYRWVLYLIALGVVSILGIAFFSFVLPTLTQTTFGMKSSLSLLLFFVRVIFYFYIMNLGIFILNLERYVENKTHSFLKPVSWLDMYWQQYGIFWHILCYGLIVASYVGWLGLSFRLVSLETVQTIFIATVSLISLLSTTITGKVLDYVAESLTEYLIPKKLQLVLDAKKMFLYLGYGVYYFFIFWVMAYLWHSPVLFNKINGILEAFFERTILLTIIISITFILNRSILSKIQKILESRTESEIASRYGNRLYTFLTLLKAIIPPLIWIPIIALVLNIFGLSGKIILMAFAVIAALLVFVGQGVVQDMIKGVMYILEDVIVIGEEVIINQTVQGRIERLSLHSVSVRDYNGFLNTFSFGNITSLVSTEWKHVNLLVMVTISYDADADLALKVMRDVMTKMRKEEDYKKYITGDEFEATIFTFGEYGINLRGRIRIMPGHLNWLRSDYSQRLLRAFHENKIGIPSAEYAVSTGGKSFKKK
jgi:small-conductance mechanosensitive channel